MMNSNEKGITLVEVLAATVLLSIAVIVFLNISGFMSSSRSSDDRRAEALILAEQTLSQYRANYAVPANRVSTNLTTSSSGNEVIIEFSPPEQPQYSVKIQHSPLIDSANFDMTNVRERFVSLQAVILVKNTVSNTFVPRLMTVTVSWDG